jgi:hypothetical protein
MASAPPQANIDLGRVMSRGFSALGANFLPFFAVALLLVGLPMFGFNYFALTSAETADPEMFLSPAFWLPAVGSLLAYLLGTVLLQGVLTRSTILHLSGRAPDLPGSLVGGLQLLLPLIGLIICVGFLIFGGFILLIVPGIMVWCAFAVAVPALVEERRGVFASMARSRELSRGSRWLIFALGVFLWIISTIVNAIAGTITGASLLGTEAVPNPLLTASANGIGTGLTALISTVLIAALYVELREVKEGAGAGALADVFG